MMPITTTTIIAPIRAGTYDKKPATIGPHVPNKSGPIHAPMKPATIAPAQLPLHLQVNPIRNTTYDQRNNSRKNKTNNTHLIHSFFASLCSACTNCSHAKRIRITIDS